jgi:uncharacterized phage protein (TIGR01671 family)
MSREIKFRAWDDGKMYHSHNNDINRGSHQLRWFFDKVREDAIIMQFTGLYDKNGKEIYEGDIVKLNDLICPITWDDGGYQMITSSTQGKSAAIQQRLVKFEVIGNIFENPDLL